MKRISIIALSAVLIFSASALVAGDMPQPPLRPAGNPPAGFLDPANTTGLSGTGNRGRPVIRSRVPANRHTPKGRKQVQKKQPAESYASYAWGRFCGLGSSIGHTIKSPFSWTYNKLFGSNSTEMSEESFTSWLRARASCAVDIVADVVSPVTKPIAKVGAVAVPLGVIGYTLYAKSYAAGLATGVKQTTDTFNTLNAEHHAASVAAQSNAYNSGRAFGQTEGYSAGITDYKGIATTALANLAAGVMSGVFGK